MNKRTLLFPLFACLGFLPLLLRHITKPGWEIPPELALFFVTTLPTPQSPSTILIHFASQNLPLMYFMGILWILLTLILFLQFYVVKKFCGNNAISFISVCILALSSFSLSAVSQMPQILISTLLFLGIILTLQSKHARASMTLLALSLLLPPLHSILICIFTIGFLLTQDTKKWNLVSISSIVFVCSVLSIFVFQQVPTLNTNPLFWLFSEWGILGGITLLTCALSVATFVINWKRLHKQSILALFVAIIGCVFFVEITFFLWPLIAYASAWMIHVLFHYKWQTQSFRYAIIVIICIGLLWSFATLANNIAQQNPTDSQQGVYDFVATLSGGTILTPPEISQSIAVHTNLTTLPASSQHSDEVAYANTLYNDLRLEELNTAFLQNNITYIWLPRNDFSIDLRYALNIERAFDQIYEDQNTAIYKFRFRNESGTILLQ